MRGIVAGFFAAVLVQPLVFFLRLSLSTFFSWIGGATHVAEAYVRTMGQFPLMGFYVVVVAAAFVLVLGIPAFVALKRLNRLSWSSIACAGFLAAAIPIAIYSWPLWTSNPGSSFGGNWYGTYVEFERHGVTTVFGWLNYLENVVWFGIQGLAGAMVFYWAWLKTHESSEPKGAG